jgi:PDZ domain
LNTSTVHIGDISTVHDDGDFDFVIMTSNANNDNNDVDTAAGPSCATTSFTVSKVTPAESGTTMNTTSSSIRNSTSLGSWLFTVINLDKDASNSSIELDTGHTVVRSNTSPKNKNLLFSRVVFAPPDSLGISIDTSVDGLIVQEVSPDSPLIGSISTNNIIISINDVDTRAIPVKALHELMTQALDVRKVLTILSESKQDTYSNTSAELDDNKKVL